jgi:hypothetical protein
LSLASSGFPLKWGVKTQVKSHFSFKNGVVYKMKIISSEEPQATKTDNKMNLYFVFVFVLEKISKTEHMAKF